MRVRLALACALFCALTLPLAAAHDPNSPSDTFAALAKSLSRLRKSEMPGLRQRAQANDPRAQTMLAIAYRDGILVDKDPQFYLEFIKSAAETGYAVAQAELGTYFAMNGNREEGVSWLTKAVAQGEVDAEFRLGVMYAKGEAAPDNRPDMARAVPLFLKAAQQGHPEAQYIVATAYREGTGVDHDEAECTKWMLASADQGYGKAQFSVAARYYVAVDYKNAFLWFLRAAEQKHSRAELNVASMYFVGDGTAKDFQQALYWYQRAAEHGESSALRMIGSMYSNGKGVRRDMVASYAYMQAALESGNHAALKEIESISVQLSEEQLAEAKRRASQLVIHQPPQLSQPQLAVSGTIPASQP